MPKLIVRLISPWKTEIETDSALFSARVPASEADALVCEWAPSVELFTFPRRKAWYCCEPPCQFRGIAGGSWPKIKKRLAPHEFLCHNHPDPRYRVAHITHFEPLQVNLNDNRLEKAVAIVSNDGGDTWRRARQFVYRNRFVTHPLVDTVEEAHHADPS